MSKCQVFASYFHKRGLMQDSPPECILSLYEGVNKKLLGRPSIHSHQPLLTQRLCSNQQMPLGRVPSVGTNWEYTLVYKYFPKDLTSPFFFSSNHNYFYYETEFPYKLSSFYSGDIYHWCDLFKMTVVKREVGLVIFPEIEKSTIIKIRKRKICIHLFVTCKVRVQSHSWRICGYCWRNWRCSLVILTSGYQRIHFSFQPHLYTTFSFDLWAPTTLIFSLVAQTYT